MPNIIELLPHFIIGAVIGFLLVRNIMDRAKAPLRVTFYHKASKPVTINLKKIESSGSGRTISWEMPEGWTQGLFRLDVDDLIAIKVRDRRRSFTL